MQTSTYNPWTRVKGKRSSPSFLSCFFFFLPYPVFAFWGREESHPSNNGDRLFVFFSSVSRLNQSPPKLKKFQVPIVVVCPKGFVTITVSIRPTATRQTRRMTWPCFLPTNPSTNLAPCTCTGTSLIYFLIDFFLFVFPFFFLF